MNLIKYILKTATQKNTVPPPPLHPLAVIRAQNNGIPPQLLSIAPGKAVDILWKRLMARKIPELQYYTKNAAADDYANPVNLALYVQRLKQQRQTDSLFNQNAWRPLSSVTQGWSNAHAIPDPEQMKGEGQHVLSMNTTQDISNPKNIGSYGRGNPVAGINHRFFGG